ncbi:MAG: sulfotransferase [Desulfobacteraceae bacterium]|nr:sulfotransferase [Desulfobacteraceae bacterium]
MIPFDYKMQWRIFKLHFKHKGLGATTWRYLLLLLPVIILNHIVQQFFFLLDEVFFRSYRKISTDGAIFMVGPPRCGTSLFLELLNKSDEITSMKLWELNVAPAIIQKLFYLQIGKLDRWLGSPLYNAYRKIDAKLFGEFKKIHDTGLFHYEEDAMLFYHSGNSPFFLFFFPFIELKTPFMNFDQLTSPEYKAKYMKFYKRCIQKHLYVFGRHKIYLSKNPLFSTYILTLKAHITDARFIFMTRTPYKVAPSAISLSTYYKDYLRYVDDQFIKDALFQMLKIEYTYPLEVLDFNDQKHHAMIRFEDLVADTKATVERVLTQFSLRCPEELQKALAERSKKEKHYVSQNRYSFEKYNISEAEFKNYFEEVLLKFGYEEEGV